MPSSRAFYFGGLGGTVIVDQTDGFARHASGYLSAEGFDLFL